MLDASTSRPRKRRRASARRSTAVPRSLCDDVVGHVEEVDAQPDHRGLVADVVDAGERALDGIGVADVPSGPRVEHADVVAAGAQGVGDVRADEAGASGDEHEHHAQRTAVTRDREGVLRTCSASRNGIAAGPCLASGAP